MRDEAGAMLGIGGEERTCDPDCVTALKMSKRSFCIVKSTTVRHGIIWSAVFVTKKGNHLSQERPCIGN